MKTKSSKPVSRRKFYSNLKALTPKKRNKLIAFVPMLLEIITQQESKH